MTDTQQNKNLSNEQTSNLLKTLQTRFERNMNRHPNMLWSDIQAKLESDPQKLWSLFRMEETGGEPDVVSFQKENNMYLFFDCSPESPKGRRSICYDGAALRSRKEHKPATSAMELAEEMGISLLNEEQYRYLQELGEFDIKTSSWILTSEKVRGLGGALFCDRRYNTVFVYHNGAESYYGARGFRGVLLV